MVAPTKPAPQAAEKSSPGKSRKMVLPPALGSYVTIFEPREIPGSDGGPKYSISLLWDENDPKLADVKRAILDVAVAKFGPKAKEWLNTPGSKFHNPLRSGTIERPDDAVYAGKLYMNASSKNKPNLVDRKLNKIFEEEEAYSGCTFRAQVSFFAFDKAMKKGIGVGLNNLQVVAKGDRIDGRESAESVFADFVDEGDGESSGNDDLIG